MTHDPQMVELRPCVFCGASELYTNIQGGGLWFVGCNHCEATGPTGAAEWTAREWWNGLHLRAPDVSHDPQMVAASVSDQGPWLPIETAPKDGTLLLLLVDYSGEDGNHWIDDEESGLGRTVGHNNDDNVGDGEGEGWQFAGWCWSHDHYVEGAGQPVWWMPLPLVVQE